MAETLVSVRGLVKTYQTKRGEVTALDTVSIDIAQGETLVLLGPSGCGKTTLLRCVAGLEYPDAGEIWVHGNKVFSSDEGIAVPPEKRKLSMVFQSYALWPHMSVFDNIAYPLKVSKTPKAEITAQVERILSVTGLEKFATNYPGQLSGGQQQRVALARALVASDGLILFDEPLSNLDAKVRERLREELFAMQAEFGFTAIYVTHDQVEAAALASRIAVMQVGTVAQLGTPADIFNAPQSGYVADFVGCTNAIDGTVADVSGETVAVDTALGRLSGVAGTVALARGDAARVMFRPEHARMVTDPNSANALSATVGHGTFLGSHFEYRIDAGGHPLLLRSMSGDALARGSAIRFAVDPALTRVFPAA